MTFITYIKNFQWKIVNVPDHVRCYVASSWTIVSIEFMYMACSMANRTGSGLHVSDLLEIFRIDRLTQVMKKPKI